MHIVISLVSLPAPARGESDRLLESFSVDVHRDGQGREEFLRGVAQAIKELAKKHNAEARSLGGS